MVFVEGAEAWRLTGLRVHTGKREGVKWIVGLLDLKTPVFHVQRRFRFENSWLPEPIVSGLRKTKIEDCRRQLRALRPPRDVASVFGIKVEKVCFHS
ncbi:conserved hypothetical protein [Ricinus communis]|uniref:Uncharacterized protein n=1 Tax=Ricinus communis TaxID=3988 RepID=B9S3G7_RICCO|nr:conserved hypothetical protein [Ricinus communis]